MNYQPQPGTIPARVIAYLRERPGQWIASAVIAHDLECDSHLGPFMITAVKAGAVRTEKRGGRVYLSAGDGTPVQDFPDNDDEPGMRKSAATEAQASPGVDIDAVYGKAPTPEELAEQRPRKRPMVAEQPAAASLAGGPARFALWSDGSLYIERAGVVIANLTVDETRGLVVYLERMVEVAA